MAPRRIKRVHFGPIDVVGVPTGVTRRALDNRVTRAITQRVEKMRHTVPSTRHLITKEELAALAARDPEAKPIVDQISGLSWYHTLDLGHGVFTPGFVDHREQLGHYGLEASLKGKRCLDIATFDGFWAFEFERRGADEVVAIDIPDKKFLDTPQQLKRDPEGFHISGPLGESFKVAHKILDSKVKRVEKSVYELNPDTDGMFDLVFISDVLVHLRDPQLAIERAYSVCKGDLIIADVFNPALEAFGDVPIAQFTSPGETWWLPNVACLKQMMRVAGFEPVHEVSRFVLDSLGHRNDKVVLRGTANPEPSWAAREKAARVRRHEASKVMDT